MTDVNHITLGEIVSRMIRERGSTTTEAARRAGVSRTTMTTWTRSDAPAAAHATEIVAVAEATGYPRVKALLEAGILSASDLASEIDTRAMPAEVVITHAGRLIGQAVSKIIEGKEA